MKLKILKTDFGTVHVRLGKCTLFYSARAHRLGRNFYPNGFWRVGVLWGDKGGMWDIPKPLPNIKRMLNKWAMILRPFPVYFVVDSMDCDSVRFTSAHRASCGMSYIRQLEDIYSRAEGPTFHSRISRSDYNEFQSEWRDLGSEAFEDGHPHIIYL